MVVQQAPVLAGCYDLQLELPVLAGIEQPVPPVDLERHEEPEEPEEPERHEKLVAPEKFVAPAAFQEVKLEVGC